MPERIQRKRTKGWRMPDNTIYVGRPTKWGNPYKVGTAYTQPDGEEIILNNQQVVNLFDQAIFIYSFPIGIDEIVSELKGKNLACFCPLDKPCHADILLKIANQ